MSSPRSSLLKTGAIAVIILACGLVASCSRSGSKVALRPNFASGTTFALSVRTTIDGVFTMPDGKNVPSPSGNQFAFTIHGGDVDAQGNTAVTADVDDAVFQMIFLPLGAIFKEYSFGMKLTATGRITEFVNTETMRAAMLEPIAVYAAAATQYATTAPDVAIGRVSDDSLRAIIEPITSIWPGAPVSAGDSWDGPEVFDPLTHSYTAYHYTLDSVSDTEAVIRVETKTRLASDRPADPTLPMITESSGDGSGTIRVDPSQGSILSYDLQQNLASTVTANGAILKATAKSRTQAEMTAR